MPFPMRALDTSGPLDLASARQQVYLAFGLYLNLT
jgi:hypothetical protein